MYARWVVVTAVAACSIKDLDQTGKACPCGDGFLCDPETMMCARGVVDASVGLDGLPCYGTGPVTVCLLSAPPDTFEPQQDLLINRDMDASMCADVTGTGLAGACVIAAKTIKIDASVIFSGHGSKGIIFVATDTISIAGSIDVASHRKAGSSVRGAGGSPTVCPSLALMGIGGGAGGTFGGAGGKGGQGNGNLGGVPAAVMEPTSVRGGCGGGPGGNAANAGVGGYGGGAIYMIAGTSITVSGLIDASGESGTGAKSGAVSGTSAGGGGGGAGGLVGFDAPSVTVPGTVFANGGGGGGGASDTVSGGDGSDPVPPVTTLAPGGSGDPATKARAGGEGAAGDATGGVNGHDASGTGGGGGGGGGAGWIKVLPFKLLAGNVSPPVT